MSSAGASADIRIPVNDLRRHATAFSAPLTATAQRVLERGHYVLGPEVAGFEAEFAAYCGVAHCVGVANGTDALELALRALGVAPGTVVAVAANAAMYATSAVLAIGAQPLFVDVDAGTALMQAPDLQRAVEACATQPRAVVATHLYGRLAPMDALLGYARSQRISIIEDCAQAHGALGPDGRRAGAYGDLATFSFYPTKNLGAVGDGGAVTCNDDEIAARVRQLRQYGWSRKYTNAIAGGRNSRLDELQAAFLRVLLPHLDERNGRRSDIANRYSRHIRNPAIQTPTTAGAEYVAHLYVVRCQQRDALAAHLATQGIGTDIHYPIPDHRQPVHGDRFARVSLPVTEALSASVLTLPCFPDMHDHEVDQVITACNNWRSSP